MITLTNVVSVPPVVSTTTPLPATVTPLPLAPTNTAGVPTLPPTPALYPQNIPINPLTRAFALSSSNGAISGNGFLLPFEATTFARNPTDPSRMAVVDSRGLLYMFFGGLTAADGARIRVSPFVADFEPNTAADNQARVVQIGWSPDGQYLAFLVDAEADDRDGVWYTNDPQQGGIRFASQVFRECPPPVTACTVDQGPGPYKYNSLHFEWNQNDQLLIELYLPDEHRGAFTVVGLNTDPTHLPPIYRYDYASWSQDGSRILASGAGPDSRVGLRWVDPATGSEQMIFDASALNLWLQDAVERPNRQIVALGSVNGPDSALRLYDGSGNPLSDPIGSAKPDRVAWSSDRSAALVVETEGGTPHYYLVEASGRVTEITEAVAGALAVEWVGSAPLPPTNPTIMPTPYPVSGVQSQYGLRVNQQARVIAPNGANLRAEPSLGSTVIRRMNYFEFVVIEDGPVQADGLIWWQVQTESDPQQVGWVAESDGSTQLLSLPNP